MKKLKMFIFLFLLFVTGTTLVYAGTSDSRIVKNRYDNIYGVYDMAGASGEYVLGKSTIGTATSEVVLANKNTWYNGMGALSDRDYIIRGGLDKSLFYFGDIKMDSTANSTRICLISKKGD